MNLKGLSASQVKELVPDGIILLGYRGSVAHGTYTPSYGGSEHDDKDIMGVMIPGLGHYFGLTQKEHHEKMLVGEDGVTWDSVVYEIRKYIRLLLKSNPNVLSLLWLPDHLYIYVSEAGQHLIDNRHIFVTKQAYHAFVGYAHGQLHRMTHVNKSDLGAKRKALVDEFGYDCYTDDTEFLTRKGWKRYDDISEADQLGTVNPITLQLEFQPWIDRVDKEYNGLVYEFENRYSKCRVTPNHRMFVSSCHRSRQNNFTTQYSHSHAKWEFVPAKQLIKGRRSYYHVLSAPSPSTGKDLDIDDDYLSLIGLFLSEGSIGFRNGKPKDIRIYQTTNGNNIVWGLMKQMPPQYQFRAYKYERVAGRIDCVWSSYNKDLTNRVISDCGTGEDKHLPSWTTMLSSRQAEIVIDALLAGDGTVKDPYADVYYSKLRALVDGFQILCLLAGRDSQVYYYPHHSVHQVYVRRTHSIPKAMRFTRRGLGQRYKGRIVCFTVPNETLITRLDGKVALHGNTKNAAHLIRLLRMGIEFLTDGELHVVRNDAAELKEIKNGEWPLEKVIKEADVLFRLAQEAYIRSPLSPRPNKERAEKLLVDILSGYFGFDAGMLQREDR